MFWRRRSRGSHDLVMDRVAVPARHTVSLVDDRPWADGALYRFPPFGLLALGIAAVSLGVGRAALDAVVDLTASTESYRRITTDLPLTAATMHYFIAHYTPDSKDRLDWRASPLRAASLAGTAPALVLTVAHDPLCDEGRDYAHRLDQDGVRVAAVHHNDQMHGVLSQGRLVPAGQVIGDQVWTAIGHALHTAAAEALR